LAKYILMSNARFAARMNREIALFQKDPPFGVHLWPTHANDLTQLSAGQSSIHFTLAHESLIPSEIVGPDESPYVRGTFALSIRLTDRFVHNL
jgi:ubiquitin-protein ligase